MWWKDLLTDSKFWWALWSLVQAILFYFVTIPPTIWAAVEVLFGIVVGYFTVKDVRQKRAFRRR